MSCSENIGPSDSCISRCQAKHVTCVTQWTGPDLLSCMLHNLYAARAILKNVTRDGPQLRTRPPVHQSQLSYEPANAHVGCDVPNSSHTHQPMQPDASQLSFTQHLYTGKQLIMIELDHSAHICGPVTSADSKAEAELAWMAMAALSIA